MLKPNDKVKTKEGRQGVIQTLHWQDQKPFAATVRFNDEPNYPNFELVCKLENLTHAN